MSELPGEVGLRLKKLRNNRKLVQKDAAAMLGVHINTLRYYEQSTLIPSVENLIGLATLYNVSVDYILGLSIGKHINIDDCTPEQQDLILDLVKVARNYVPEKKDAVGRR